MAIKLTQQAVNKARWWGKATQEFVWDEDFPGFGLRLTAGSKSYVIQFRNQGQTKRKTLGTVAELTVDEARQMAVVAAQLRQQTDAKIAQQQPISDGKRVGLLMQSFVEDYVKKRHKPTTQRTEIQIIQQHIIPKLGDKLLCELTTAQITEWHSGISAPIAANRALAHLSKACSFAVQRDWMRYNPCKGVERNKEQIKDRYFSDAELRLLFDELCKGSKPHYDLLVVLALTGVRCGELLDGGFNADLQRAIVRFSDTKTGAKTVPLSPYVVNYLLANDLPTGITYHSLDGRFRTATDKLKIAGVGLHTFRHTLATYMAEHGASVFQIAAMGGWKTLSMVQRYVSLHGVGKPNPTPADERIAKAIGLLPLVLP